jgi:RNA polymerase sigma-70 factor (ECF subfamily)
MSDDFVETIQLVREAQGGDRAALESLFERYLPRVRQIVALRLGFQPSQFDQHEEIVQEALVNTFKNLDRYEERSQATFRHWISKCVVNSIRQHFRRAGAQKRGSGQVKLFGSYEREDASAIVFQGDEPTPSVVYGRKEVLQKVEQALLEMKEHWREVIVQRLFCEMSYAEIGEEMGIREEATVRKLFSRAMSELRRCCNSTEI